MRNCLRFSGLWASPRIRLMCRLLVSDHSWREACIAGLQLMDRVNQSDCGPESLFIEKTSCLRSPNSCSWRLQLTKHYQGGYIRFATRKSVPSRWEFLWRENNETGMLVRRTIVIGTVEKYPTVELANAAKMALGCSSIRREAA
jgi:hypothetical protein